LVTILLLILTYLAFIGLGLPESLLGVALPAIQSEWGISLDSAGLIYSIIIGSTIVSNFLSGYIIKKVGTGKILFISFLMTGCALLGFSFAPSYMWFVIFSVPLGFGAGIINVALNNYVALHFKSRHMNWLHSFWGIGATLGPIVMAASLGVSLSWRTGYRTVSIIQLSFAFLLLLSLPLWSKHKSIKSKDSIVHNVSDGIVKVFDRNIFRMKGILYALFTFVFYTVADLSIRLWGSSYLVQIKGLSINKAAFWIAVYYGSITVGRFILGFASFKVSNPGLIRIGISTSLLGTLLFFLPLPSNLAIIPFIILGLGLSPILPAMMHETPNRFGAEKSQAIIGYQLACGSIGGAFFPPLIGVIMKNIAMAVFPVCLLISVIIVYFCTEKLRLCFNPKSSK